MLHVVKRDGRKAEFNSVKITNAIKGAAEEIAYNLKESEAVELTQKVIKNIEDLGREEIAVEEVQNIVEHVLSESDYKLLKGTYSNYRKERNKVREIKSDLMKAIEKIGVETDRDNGATSCC